MKKFIFLSAAFLLFSSHDMFLKMDSFFLKPLRPTSIHLYNGTFEKSDNAIARTRMQDVSLLGNGVRQHPADSQWVEVGKVTVLNFESGEPGTWVAGVSTKANSIELAAKEFNEYLEHDGVTDMLDWRKQNNALGENAIEKYSKHVKSIFQVGDKKTEDWKTPLGYPIEFLPLSNPYDLKVGNSLKIKLLRNGQPLANQLVYSGFAADGHEHEHKKGEEHRHDEGKMTTDAEGIVTLKIDHEGHWFLRTIQMTRSEEPGLTHESNWATLAFEVRQQGQSHQHGGIPTMAYLIAGLLALTGLFFYFRLKQKS